jgi:general secretion pathway protein C
MLARLSALVIWGLVAATAVFWGLRVLVRAPAAPTYVVAVGDAAATRGDLTRLLGSSPAAPTAAAAIPEAASRFRLLGIVAPKNASTGNSPASNGVALIAVDGKMPKAYAVGSRLDGDLVLQSVSLRTVSIAAGQGAPAIKLELPLPTAAATGSLPVGGMGGMPAAAPAVVPQYVPQPMLPQATPPSPVPPVATPTLVPNPPRTESGAPIQ